MVSAWRGVPTALGEAAYDAAMELSGRHVVVTGAAGGIGEALAARFHAEGARVVLSDVQAEAVGEVAGRLNAVRAGSAVAVPADVGTEAGNVALVAAAEAAFGPIDLFFANHPFHDTVQGRVRTVPFADTRITVLDCTSLAVFKAFFDRTKDWADLEAMAAIAGRPVRLTVPGAAMRLALGDVADSVLHNRRMIPARALELGYEFSFADLSAALRDVLGSGAA